MTTSQDPDGRFAWRHALGRLFSLNEAPWNWSAGAQAAAAAGLPLAVFTLADRRAFGLVALLGSFTALYGAKLRLSERAYALPFVATGFVVAAGLGVLCAANVWLSIACLTVVAALACSIAFRVGLGPPGPMQFVLVAGICGDLAAPASLGGASMNAGLVPLLVAVGAVSAYLIVILPLALPSVRRRDGGPTGLGTIPTLEPLDREAAIVIARVVVAAGVAGMASLPLGVERSHWVIMVAGAMLQASHTLHLTAIRAAQRVLGTFFGLAVFGLVAWIGPQGVWLVITIALLLFAIQVVAGRNFALAMIFITPVALTIAAAGGTEDLLGLAGERIVDTLLGATIAGVVLGTGEWLRERSG